MDRILPKFQKREKTQNLYQELYVQKKNEEAVFLLESQNLKGVKRKSDKGMYLVRS
jgi:hypothetical protein